MEHPKTSIEIRRPWSPGETLFLLGPGGVGKSTLGQALAKNLGWALIDLDLEFCSRLDVIGRFIADHGYQRYRDENLALAKHLIATNPQPSVFVTASGFLAAPATTSDHADARALVATGYRIVLLPSLDVEKATAVVVERQLTRGFGLERATEDRKFRERFLIYRNEGDALVVSLDTPANISAALSEAISLAGQTNLTQFADPTAAK